MQCSVHVHFLTVQTRSILYDCPLLYITVLYCTVGLVCCPASVHPDYRGDVCHGVPAGAGGPAPGEHQRRHHHWGDIPRRHEQSLQHQRNIQGKHRIYSDQGDKTKWLIWRRTGLHRLNSQQCLPGPSHKSGEWRVRKGTFRSHFSVICAKFTQIRI